MGDQLEFCELLHATNLEGLASKYWKKIYFIYLVKTAWNL